jgi:hypothetical protein
VTPQNVIAGTSTDEPGRRCMARRESSMAAVQEDTATASAAPSHAANSVSKAAHSGPEVSHPDARERTAAAWASGVTTGRVKATLSCVIHASSSPTG